METSELKHHLIRLIGDCIDEETLPSCDSFVEMDQAVLHFAGAGGERYFRVTLTTTTEDQYFKPYDPELGDAMALRALLQEVYDHGENSDLHARIRVALGIVGD